MKSKHGTRRPGVGGVITRYVDDAGGIRAAGTKKQKQPGGWEGDCRPQKHLALGVKKAMRSPRDGGRGSPPLARRLGALVLYFLNDRQEACVFLLHGPRRIACL